MLPAFLARQKSTITEQSFQSRMTTIRSIFLKKKVVKLFQRKGITIDILDVSLTEKEEGPEWRIKIHDKTRKGSEIKGKGLCTAKIKCECGLQISICSEIKNGSLYFKSCAIRKHSINKH